jgi:hypothetical protein
MSVYCPNKCVFGSKKMIVTHKDENAFYCLRCKHSKCVSVKIACFKCGDKHNFHGFNSSQLHCDKCMEPGMTNHHFKVCVTCKVGKASYGFEPKQAIYCAKCKVEGTFNSYKIRCQVCHQKEATFGYFNRQPITCKGCMLPNMIDVMNTKCCICKKARYNKTSNNKKYCDGCLKKISTPMFFKPIFVKKKDRTIEEQLEQLQQQIETEFEFNQSLQQTNEQWSPQMINDKIILSPCYFPIQSEFDIPPFDLTENLSINDIKTFTPVEDLLFQDN